MRTWQEGGGCWDCPGNGNFLRSSREVGTHPDLPSSCPPIHHSPAEDGPPGSAPGVRWFTEARQLTRVCKQLHKPRRKCRQRLDPPEGPLGPRGLAQAKTLDSWGFGAWTSQPTCSGKSTPRRPPTLCPGLTAQARASPPKARVGSGFPCLLGSQRWLRMARQKGPHAATLPRNLAQGPPMGQQGPEVTAHLPAGWPHRRDCGGSTTLKGCSGKQTLGAHVGFPGSRQPCVARNPAEEQE